MFVDKKVLCSNHGWIIRVAICYLNHQCVLEINQHICITTTPSLHVRPQGYMLSNWSGGLWIQTLVVIKGFVIYPAMLYIIYYI